MNTLLLYTGGFFLGVGLTIVCDWFINTAQYQKETNKLKISFHKMVKDKFQEGLDLRTKIGEFEREKVLLTNELARTKEKLKGSETRFKKFTKGTK